MLEREDLKKEPSFPINEERKAGDIPVLFHDVFTNGISYSALLFSLKYLPEDLYPYAGLLSGLLGLVDTKEHKYDDLFNEINIHTGGIRPSFANYTDYRSDEINSYILIRAKYLKDEKSQTFKLLKEIIADSDYTDTKRLLEILNEAKMRLQSAMQSSGHVVASIRASSYFSKDAWIFDKISGSSYYRFLCDLTDNFEDRKEDLIKKLYEVCSYVFRPENMMADFTGTEDDYSGYEQEVSDLATSLSSDKELKEAELSFDPVKKNEGLKLAGQIQFVALAGTFRNKGLEYTGALRVLRVLMGYDYLWNKVRVLGGAYGCMSAFKKNGDSYFVSYRDPNLKGTLDVYKGAAEYIRNIELSDRQVLQYIIGALADLDAPLTPSGKGNYSLGTYLSGISNDDIKKERKELLEVDNDIIRSLSEYINAFIEDDNLCVVGNADAIEENKDLFMNTEQLI